MKTFNTLIQSSASDMMLHGSYKAYQELKAKGYDAYPLLWVHDELVVEFDATQEAEVVEIVDRNLTALPLETPWGLIPIRVEGAVAEVWQK